MRFVMLIAKNLAHRPVRSLLTVVGLSIALSAVMLLVGISWNFEKAFLEIYTSKAIDLVVTKAGKSMSTGGILDLSVGERLKAIAGIDEVTPVLIDTVEFKDQHIDEMVVQGWVPGSLMFRGVRLVRGEGRNLKPDDQNAILLGDEQAASFGKKAGDQIRIQKKLFEIVGVFDSASLFERGSIIMPLATLQSLMGYNQPATAFMIKAQDRDGAFIKALRTRIEGSFPDLSARSASDYISNDRQIRLSRVMAWTTAGVALIVGAVGMLNTMLMSIFERTREIGLLRRRLAPPPRAGARARRSRAAFCRSDDRGERDVGLGSQGPGRDSLGARLHRVDVAARCHWHGAGDGICIERSGWALSGASRRRSRPDRGPPL